MLGALLTGLSYASLGSRYPRAAGAAYITHRAFGFAVLSYVIGIAVMMSGLTSMATGTQAIAENIMRAGTMVNDPASTPVSNSQGPSAGDSAGQVVDPSALPADTIVPSAPASAAPPTVIAPPPSAIPSIEALKSSPWLKPIAILVVLAIGLVLVKGIRESMWLNIICTFVEASGLIFIIVVGCRYWGSVNYWEIPTLQTNGVSALAPILLSGALLTFFSFIGFEDILNVSEEVKNPRKDIPIGLIGAMILATLIYMGVAITAVSVIPHAVLAKSPTPLMDVAHKAAPWFRGIDKLYIVITIFAVGNTALLNYLMGSRLLYGMSRQGLLPAFLGRVHHRTRTPIIAIGTLFLIVAVLVGLGNVKQLAEATVLLLLSVFVAMNLGLIRLKLRKDEPPGAFEVPLFVPILGALVCLTLIGSKLVAAWSSDSPPARAARVSALIALAILAGAALLYVLMRPKSAVAEEIEVEA
jgi:amino acid transporter